MPLFAREKYPYVPLIHDGNPNTTITLRRFVSRKNLIIIVCAACALPSSFWAGRWSAGNQSLLSIPHKSFRSVRAPLSERDHSIYIIKTFRYNGSYGSAPANHTDTAWASLFPVQGGFFKDPQLAPQRSAFSVFHQLHCLVGTLLLISVS